MCTLLLILSFFFVNDTATTEIYTYLHTLSLHDALPILISSQCPHSTRLIGPPRQMRTASGARIPTTNASDATTPMPLARRYRSEEHTSELQSLMRISYDVFCLKKKKNSNTTKSLEQFYQQQDAHKRVHEHMITAP